LSQTPTRIFSAPILEFTASLKRMRRHFQVNKRFPLALFRSKFLSLYVQIQTVFLEVLKYFGKRAVSLLPFFLMGQETSYRSSLAASGEEGKQADTIKFRLEGSHPATPQIRGLANSERS